MNDSSVKREHIKDLLMHGFHGKICDVFSSIEKKITKMTDELENIGTKKFLIWKNISDNLPSKFFTEIILCQWNDAIYGLGPRCDKYFSVIKIDVDDVSNSSVFEVKGDPNVPFACTIIMEMPGTFVHDGHIYLGFINGREENGYFEFVRMNLETFRMEKVMTSGIPPVINRMAAYEFHFLNNEAYVITPTYVTSLNMNTLHWGRPRTIGGMIPLYLSTCSHFSIGNKIFSMPFADGDDRNKMYELCLESTPLMWKKKEMVGIPPSYGQCRDTHVFRRYGDKYVCITANDNLEVWFFDPVTLKWEHVESIGKRPGNHRLNPSYIIIGDTLYCFGGTSAAMPNYGWNRLPMNTLSKIDLKPRDVTFNFSKMYDAKYSDIRFIFENGKSIPGHKVILCKSNKKMEDLIENRSEVMIKGHSFEAFETFIKYFYNIDDLENSNLFDVHRIAVEFSEDALKQKIEKMLRSEKIDPLDALCFFAQHDNDDYKRLKRKALSDCVNKSKKICTSKKFEDFVKNNGNLAAELFVELTKTLH